MGSGTLDTIDLGAETSAYPTDRQAFFDAEVSQSRRGDGRTFTAFHGGSVMVKVQCTGITDQTQVDDLRVMLRLLKLGRSIGFALDADHAWGSYTTTAVTRGSTSTGVRGNLWYEPSPTIDAGGRLLLESPPPESQEEVITQDSGLTATSRVLTHASRSPKFTYAGPVHVRHPDFWPVLVLPSGESPRNLLKSIGDRVWELNLTLIYDVGTALAVAQGRPIRQNGAVYYEGYSLDDAAEEANLAMSRVATTPDPRFR